MIEPGRTRSTKMFFSSTISSPAGERKPSKTGRADWENSSHAIGFTMPSM